MKIKEVLFAFLLFVFISFIFFNKTILQGQIPFPGDLLIGNYEPYRSYSFMGFTPGSYPHKAQGIDVLEQLYPWKHFSIEMLKKNDFPLWNPYNFSGTPHIAAIQSGTFYPLNILFFLPFSFATSWSIYIILQPILIGFFTFLLLREYSLSFKNAFLGGLAFAFSLFLVVWMEYGNMVHAAMWLPFAMFLSLKILKKPTVVKSLVLSIVLAFSILAGHLQVSLYSFVFLSIFILFNSINLYGKEWFRNVIVFIPIFLLSLFLSAAQLLPAIEIFSYSSRSSYSVERILNLLIPSEHLITAVFPDFFGNPATRNYWMVGTYIERVSYFGVVPLFFAVYAIISKKKPIVWFFIGTAIAIFLLSFNTPLSSFLYSYFLPPIISTSVPTRIMFLFAFAGSILAAFGYYQIEKKVDKKKLLVSISFIFSLIILTWVFVFISPYFTDKLTVENLSIAKRNLVIPTIVAFFAASTLILYSFSFRKNLFLEKTRESIRKYFFIAIILVLVFELYFFFQKITPFSPRQALYPKTSVFDEIKRIQGTDRTWGYGSANLEQNIETYEKIYSTDGYDPFHIKRYGELLSTSNDGKIMDPLPRSEAHVAGGYGPGGMGNRNRQKILNLLGVKYILHRQDLGNVEAQDDEVFDRGNFELLWGEGRLQIYRNKNVLPRVFLASDYVVEKNDKKIIDLIHANGFDPRKTIILEEDFSKDLGEDPNSNVAVETYTPNKTVFKTESQENSLMFISDAYFPGWKAYIDGQPASIYRADYALRAVFVPKGEHEVILKYDPLYFKIGLWISIVSILAILVLLGLNLSRRKNA